MSRWLLKITKDGDSTTSLGNWCQCLVPLTVKRCFLMFRENFLCFSLCPFPLVLSLGTTEKSLAPSFLYPPFRGNYRISHIGRDPSGSSRPTSCSLQYHLNCMTKTIVQTLLELWQAWCHDHFPFFQWSNTLSEKNLFLISSLNFPDTASFHFLLFYHWAPETGDQNLLLCCPS